MKKVICPRLRDVLRRTAVDEGKWSEGWAGFGSGSHGAVSYLLFAGEILCMAGDEVEALYGRLAPLYHGGWCSCLPLGHHGPCLPLYLSRPEERGQRHCISLYYMILYLSIPEACHYICHCMMSLYLSIPYLSIPGRAFHYFSL
jgi:hypothetical protein